MQGGVSELVSVFGVRLGGLHMSSILELEISYRKINKLCWCLQLLAKGLRLWVYVADVGFWAQGSGFRMRGFCVMVCVSELWDFDV